MKRSRSVSDLDELAQAPDVKGARLMSMQSALQGDAPAAPDLDKLLIQQSTRGSLLLKELEDTKAAKVAIERKLEDTERQLAEANVQIASIPDRVKSARCKDNGVSLLCGKVIGNGHLSVNLITANAPSEPDRYSNFNAGRKRMKPGYVIIAVVVGTNDTMYLRGHEARTGKRATESSGLCKYGFKREMQWGQNFYSLQANGKGDVMERLAVIAKEENKIVIAGGSGQWINTSGNLTRDAFPEDDFPEDLNRITTTDLDGMFAGAN